MTFAEKLVRLRKREGLSQEALAELLGVSRQAVSRWEQGTALPDAAKLLPCARLFQVRVDWLLDEEQDWEAGSREEEKRPAGKKRDLVWILAGSALAGLSLLGLLMMGIFSSMYPATVSEAPVGVDWVHVYTGLTGFLKFHHLEWLFALCLVTTAAGLWMTLRPWMRRKIAGNPILQSNLVLLPIAAQAGLVYSTAQSLWWIQMGRENYWGAFWFSVVPLLAASIWMVRNLLLEQDVVQRRKNSRMELGYCFAQLAVGLLTAGEGIGLVGLALNVILCLVYIQWVNPRYMNRRFARK